MKKILIAAILFLVSVLPVFAQTNIDEAQGLKPYDSFHGGDLDSVSLTTGGLALHVPLLSYPQRGSLSLAFSLTYSSKQWTVVTKCTVDGSGNQVCTSKWEPLPRGGRFPVLVTPNSSIPPTGAFVASSTDWWRQTDFDTSTGQSSRNFVSPDGNVHSFGASFANGLQFPMRSLDASGLLQPDNLTLILPNGVRFSYDTAAAVWPASVTDPNGNQITIAASGWTDTMGRLIPASSNEPGIATTDLSTCPAGTVSARVWDVPGYTPVSATRRFKLCYSSVSIFTNFGIPNITEYSATPSLLTAVVLPDDTMWTLDYDNYGDVTRLGFPTGGSISYTYGAGPVSCGSDTESASRWVTSRTVDANDGTGPHTWQYNYQGQFIFDPQTSKTSYSGTVTVTSPDLNDTVHTIISPVLGAYCSLFDTQVQYYQGPAANHALLKTATTQYSGIVDVFTGSFNTADNVVPTQTTVAFPGGAAGGPTSQVDIQYDSNNSFTEPDAMGVGMTIPVVFGSVLQRDEYDFYTKPAPPTLVRSTVNHYLWEDNATYKDENFLGLVTSTTVKDGAGQQVAQTTSDYDQNALVSSGVSTSHVAPPAGEPYRGNLTTVSHWLNTTNTFLSSTATYYDTGMKATSTPPANPDGKSRTTTYFYDPVKFFGAYLTETDMPDTQMPDTGAAVVHHIITGDYDFNTGLLTKFTDENGQDFTYTYDNMLRLAHANHPDGGQTIFTYPDPVTVDRQRLIDGTRYDHYQVHFDGLGRSIQTRQFTPDCGTYVKVDTTYDSVGRAKTVSNPYCVSTEATYGITTSDYDALSRTTKTTKQDQSFSTVKYEDTPDDPSGAPLVCTTATDESGHQRQSCTDSLGRLAKVVEPNPGAPATSATGSVIISGTEQTATTQPATPASVTVTIGGSDSVNIETLCTPTCHEINIADAGTMEFTVVAAGVTVGPVSVNYMGGSTPETLAAALYSAFPANSVVTMSDPNGTASFTLTTVATGSAANTSTISTQMATSCVDSDTLACSGPGWTMTLSGPNLAPTTASSANFTGGQDAATTDDSGNVTVTVNGTPYTTAFGTGDSAGSIAGRLASLITAGSWATATTSGGTINLTSKTPGSAGDYSLSASYTWNSAQFNNPSFTTSSSGSLSGALDASALNNNPFVTIYQYDTLGNLLRVDQKGSAPSDSSQWRTRLFTYDSLSRLLTASNPESGSMTYNYDPDGNLTSKLEPAPNQLWGGTAQVTVTYSYDALDRLLDKNYSDGATPQASYRYDYSSFMGQTFAYPIGRQVASFVAGGAPQYFTSYDPMGRVAQTVQCNPGVTGCKTFTAGYDRLGDVTTLGYPANSFSVTYSYDSAARLYDATDSNGVVYAHLDPTSQNSFWPTGAMKEFTSPNFAGNKYHVDYNNRLQPTEIWTGASQGAGALFDKQYSYGATGSNNGNIFTITNVKDSTRTQNFTYDALNRLISAHDQTHWGNTYTYDAWGNLQKVPGSPAGEDFQHAADENNHLTGYSYDAAGNLLQDGINPWTYVYDAENRITTAGSTSYTYDADGRRVQKSSGTNYWYGPTGAVLAETDAAGAWTNYIFFGGQRLARNVPQAAPNPPDIKYYITDHLHSTGMFVDQSGTVLDDNDFYPWGGVVPGVGQTTSDNHYKFTGKERDSESQLDYFGARYYSNITGRFMTPDWAAKPVTVPYATFLDPQSLNLYGYVQNHPINRIDIDGHFDDPFGVFSDGDTSMSNIQSSHTHLDHDIPGFWLTGNTVIITIGNTTTTYWANGGQVYSSTTCTKDCDDGSAETTILVGIRHLLKPFPINIFHHTLIGIPTSQGLNTYEVLGEIRNGKGTSRNQEVQKNDPIGRNRTASYTLLFVTMAQKEALVTRLDYWSTAGHICPSCGTNYRAWFLSWSHFIDGYNSNTFVYNMLIKNPAGPITPPPESLAPGYHEAAGDWYPGP